MGGCSPTAARIPDSLSLWKVLCALGRGYSCSSPTAAASGPGQRRTLGSLRKLWVPKRFLKTFFRRSCVCLGNSFRGNTLEGSQTRAEVLQLLRVSVVLPQMGQRGYLPSSGRFPGLWVSDLPARGCRGQGPPSPGWQRVPRSPWRDADLTERTKTGSGYLGILPGLLRLYVGRWRG